MSSSVAALYDRSATPPPTDDVGGPLSCERIAKGATLASVVSIVLFQLAAHPDLTWVLRALAVLAIAIGWFGARSGWTMALWLLAAPVAPALLHVLTGREGPVLDIVWMAGLAALLVRVSPRSSWELPGWWGVLLGGWALLLSLAWPILLLREIGFDPVVLRDTATYTSRLLPAPTVVQWMLYVVLTHLLGVLWLEWLLARTAGWASGIPPALHGLWIGTTIASLVAIVQVSIDPAFLTTPFWASLGRATGTLLDGNAFGMAAAIAGPVAFIMVRRMPWLYATALATGVLAVNLAGMWASASRIALVCGLAGVAALVRAHWPRSTATHRPAPAFAIVTAGMLAAVLIGTSHGANPIARAVVEMPKSVKDLWDRGPYGPVALEMFREYPLAGTGPGTYHTLAPDWTPEYIGFDNAQNWWRHVLAEVGVLGALPVFLWSLAVVWLIVRGRPSPGEGPGVSTARALLVGVGIVSLVGVPTQNPVVLVWFLFLAGWLLMSVRDGAARMATPVPPTRFHRRHGWLAVTLLAGAYAGVQAVHATGPLSVVERAVRGNRPYVTGAYAPEWVEDGRQMYWTRERARFVWPAQTRWAVVRLIPPHPDLHALPVQVSLTAPCGASVRTIVVTPEPVSIGLEFPEGGRTVDFTIRVSRAWQPSPAEPQAGRRLGMGVTIRFASSATDLADETFRLQVPACNGAP